MSDQPADRASKLRGFVEYQLEDPAEQQAVEDLLARLMALVKPEHDSGDGKLVMRATYASIKLAVIGFVMMGFTPEGAADAVTETIRRHVQDTAQRHS